MNAPQSMFTGGIMAALVGFLIFVFTPQTPYFQIMGWVCAGSGALLVIMGFASLFTIRSCPHCKEMIDKQATTCPKCGKDIEPMTPSHSHQSSSSNLEIREQFRWDKEQEQK